MASRMAWLPAGLASALRATTPRPLLTREAVRGRRLRGAGQVAPGQGGVGKGGLVIRVMLVDDQELLRAGFRMVLGALLPVFERTWIALAIGLAGIAVLLIVYRRECRDGVARESTRDDTHTRGPEA